MRVLIVEENASAAQTLTTALTNMRHDVVGHARDGARAVRLADETDPDLIFLSLVLAEMDALAALRVLRRVVPGADVIVLGGPWDKRRVSEALRLGAKGQIRKPFMPADIRDAMRRYTSRRR